MRPTTPWEISVSWEDLLLIGGLLMAIAVFSGTHAHSATVASYAVTATVTAAHK